MCVICSVVCSLTTHARTPLRCVTHVMNFQFGSASLPLPPLQPLPPSSAASCNISPISRRHPPVLPVVFFQTCVDGACPCRSCKNRVKPPPPLRGCLSITRFLFRGRRRQYFDCDVMMCVCPPPPAADVSVAATPRLRFRSEYRHPSDSCRVFAC